MNFYFSTSQIPELRGLSTRQLELVDELCLRPIRLRVGVKIAKSMLLLPLLITALVMVPEWWSFYEQLIGLSVAWAIFYAADHMFDMAVLALNRRRIAKFISEQPQELQ